MESLRQFVPQVYFEQIPIKNLVSNQEYQRNLSWSHIRKAAADFNPYQINPVKVSHRDNINYVFNGQHTIEIVALASNSRETPVWCMIYDDLEYAHEAEIFANQSVYTKFLSPYEIFVAKIEAGDDKQLMIKGLIESYGLILCGNKRPNGVCAIATIERIFDQYGFHCLDRVIRLCVGTWEGDDNSFSANILGGIARLVGAFGENLKDDAFKEKVGAVSVKEVTRNAKERAAGALGFAEAMLLYYNKKSRYTPLDIRALYEGKRCAAKIFTEGNDT